MLTELVLPSCASGELKKEIDRLSKQLEECMALPSNLVQTESKPNTADRWRPLHRSV